MASASNTNPLLEYVEEGKTYEVDFGDTWNDGNSSKYSYHTIKCNYTNRVSFAIKLDFFLC